MVYFIIKWELMYKIETLGGHDTTSYLLYIKLWMKKQSCYRAWAE